MVLLMHVLNTKIQHICQFNKFGSRSDNPKAVLKIYYIMQFSFYPIQLLCSKDIRKAMPPLLPPRAATGFVHVKS